MSTRKPITAGELYVQLDREFRQRRPRECASCYLMLPFRVDRADGGPNWEVIVPAACPHGCAYVIEELVAEYGQEYDLASDLPEVKKNARGSFPPPGA